MDLPSSARVGVRADVSMSLHIRDTNIVRDAQSGVSSGRHRLQARNPYFLASVRGAPPATGPAVDARGDDAVDEQAILGPVTADHCVPPALVVSRAIGPRPMRCHFVAFLPNRFSHRLNRIELVSYSPPLPCVGNREWPYRRLQGLLTVRRCNRGSSRVARVVLACPSQCGHASPSRRNRLRNEKVSN